MSNIRFCRTYRLCLSPQMRTLQETNGSAKGCVHATSKRRFKKDQNIIDWKMLWVPFSPSTPSKSRVTVLYVGALCCYLWAPISCKTKYASVSTPSPPPPLLISLIFYTCTLFFDLFAPVPTPASSKFHSITARQKVIVLSRTLVLLAGTQLEMLQLSTPSSLP